MLGRRALAASLAVRLAVALAIRTAFAPDEYWQSLEVAHRVVFGYGHLTWEWAAGLRSYAHLLLFAGPYAVLRALHLDSAWAVVRVPLLLQALAAAATDLYVAATAALLFRRAVARWALACQLASWFNAYCLGRTYSNSLEAALAAAGTYHWLRCRGSRAEAALGSSHGRPACRSRSGGQRGGSGRHEEPPATAERRHQRAWLACAALSVVFRPSSALFWVLPAALELARQRSWALWVLLGDAALLGGGLLGAAALVDRVGYGRWVAVPWEFFRFNLLVGASAQYGGHPWHWNITQGLPTVAASLLPLLVAGLAWAGGKEARLPALLAGWSLAAYSLPAHKEFRFLLPALQLLMPYCGLAAASLRGSGNSSGQSGASKAAAVRRGGAQAASEARLRGPAAWQRWGVAACLLLQLPMAAYFVLVHQGAQVGVMQLIRREAAAKPLSTSVLFLTPCHATPYYSHVHAAIPMRFLDCSPPQYAAATAALNAAAEAWLPLPAACPTAGPGEQLSQRRCFERDPAAYLATVLEGSAHAGTPAVPPQRRPSLLVGYAPLMGRLDAQLQRWGYRPRARLRNCWVQTDEDSPCQLQLWALRDEA
ncbi:hypothetical protein ABPG75_013025 [Micractinium tetrahymenae]